MSKTANSLTGAVNGNTVSGKTVSGKTVSGIVLAGSYNWSGSSFETLRVRPLLPVALSPIIHRVLDWLDAAAVPDAIICANGSTAALQRNLGSSYANGLSLGYHHDGSPRGAGGCVKDAAAQSSSDLFIVTDGTSVPTADIPALLARHVETGAALTVVAHRRTSPYAAGTQFSPTGTYVFNRDVLDQIPATSFHDIKEGLMPKLYQDGRQIALFEVASASPRVLNADSYMALNRWMIERVSAATAPSAGRFRGLSAHPSAWVDDNAVIVGPVVLGEGARILSNATLVGPCVIGPGTTVCSQATVARSVVWENSVIGRDAFVDQCIVGEGATIDAHESIAGVLRTKTVERRRFLPRRVKKNEVASGVLARPALS
jgi:mannose-1-phosphate guanylyltransferase